MNADEWVYLSYNNQDIQDALNMGLALMNAGALLWLDRLQIAPNAQWQLALHTMQTHAKTALILKSNAYLSSDYCKEEEDSLLANQAKLIAVCLDSEAFKASSETANKYLAIIDFRPEQNRELAFLEIQSQLQALNGFGNPISEEKQYLYALILRLELELAQSATARLARHKQIGEIYEGHKLRPRCHAPSAWLEYGHYDLYEAANDGQTNHLLVDNILEWFEWRSRMMLVGQAGTGKSTLLRYLCLVSAFRRLETGNERPLPYFVELSEWTGKQGFGQFLRHQWTLTSELDELLRRGAVMLFVDGLGEDADLEKRTAKELESILNKDNYPSLLMSAREECINLEFPNDIAFIQVKYLQESQAKQIQDTILEQSEVHCSGISLESFVISLLAQKMNPNAAQLNLAEQTGYFVPALWQQLKESHNKRFTISDLLEGLESFALSIFELGQALYYPQAIALTAFSNDLLLQVALNLGILRRSGQRVRFVSNVLPKYLVARRLLHDGVYQYLKHPSFDGEGERLPQIWDMAIRFAGHLVSVEDLPLYIQTITDMDPYLAFEIAQETGECSNATIRDILGKFLENSRSSLRSMSLSIRSMNAVDDKEFLQTVLLEALQTGSWGRRLLALQFIKALDLPQDDAFAAAIKTIEIGFPDSVYAALDAFSHQAILVSLCRFVFSGAEDDRITAIHILADYAPSLASFVISQVHIEESTAILCAAIEALSKSQNQETRGFFYQLLLNPDQELLRSAINALEHGDNSLKTLLLLFLVKMNALNLPLHQAILANNEEQIRLVLSYTLGTLGYGPSHSIELDSVGDGSSDMVKRLLDLLSSKMASLSSRDDFQNFADEMLNHLGIQQRENLHHEKDVAQLALRIRSQKAPSETKLEVTENKLPENLVTALQNDDWLVRRNALEQIAKYPAADALPYLLAATEDDDPQVRITAIEALPPSRDYPVVLAALLDCLEDDDTQVIDAVAERLRHSGEIAVADLLTKLRASNEYSLATVIELLGEQGDETVVMPLANFIDDVREPWMWNHCIGDIAVQALISIGSPEALKIVQDSGRIAYPVFQDIILPGSDDELGREPNHLDIFKALLRDLQSDNWQSSQQAAKQMRSIAQSLREQDNQQLAESLSEMLDNPNWLVRWTLVESLAWLNVQSITPQLEERLFDENWMVQIASIRALIELKARKSSSAFEKLLFDKTTAVREAAAEALGEMGDAASLGALASALTDSDQFVRLAVVRAIISINDKSQANILLDALKDEYSHVRWYAIRAIAQAANPEHIQSVVPLLRDTAKPPWEKYSISNYAELALQRMASPASKKVLAKWAKIKQLNR